LNGGLKLECSSEEKKLEHSSEDTRNEHSSEYTKLRPKGNMETNDGKYVDNTCELCIIKFHMNYISYKYDLFKNAYFCEITQICDTYKFKMATEPESDTLEGLFRKVEYGIGIKT
jgi:hypothetical protein